MKELKTNNSYDIAVCGGGFAGISAALAAARQGKKVVLFEKQYILGGLGTAGLVTIYLPLCDGYGRQVSFGIAEELLRLSIKYGAEARYPENWLDGKGTRTEKDKRYQVQYNAQVFAILAEQLLTETGVDILYGSYVVDVETEGKKIKCLHVENKSGRTAYAVQAVVDATGDCDIASFAGAPTETFQQGNVLAAWYYFANQDGHQLQMLGASDTPEEEKKGTEKKPLVDQRFTGLDAKELSEMMQLSHKTTLEHWLKKRETDPTSVISTIATTPQIRMTRKLMGEYTLAHTQAHSYFEDSIGMVSNWKKRGPVYEVPFRTLYCKEVENLIVAGRCTSVCQTLWDVMRVIPCCAVTGQAAGTAAAMTDDFTTLDIAALQQKLVENGAILHEKDLKTILPGSEKILENYITGFLAEYDYPTEAREALLGAYDTIVASHKNAAFSGLLDTYAQGGTPDPTAILQEMKEISEAVGVHEYTGALLLLICYSRQLKEYYKAASLSDEIFKATMFDLKYKLTECKYVKNVWGTFVAPWLAGYFNLSRFAFGKLQFELYSFKDEYHRNGLSLTPGSKVINVHIPRTGGRLDEESRKKSYAMAAEFFAKRYGMDPIIFYCNSWLLFPKHQEIMKEGSNLLSFIRDYDIYKSGEYEDYGQIWRLFDMDYTTDHSKLPADTSLRRAYIEMMNAGEKTGWGKGIYLYQG